MNGKIDKKKDRPNSFYFFWNLTMTKNRPSKLMHYLYFLFFCGNPVVLTNGVKLTETYIIFIYSINLNGLHRISILHAYIMQI